MSASIHWRKVQSRPDPTIGTLAPSSFIEAMTEAFGGSVWTLDSGSLPVLRGMAAISKDKGFRELIELIEKYEFIEVYYSY